MSRVDDGLEASIGARLAKTRPHEATATAVRGYGLQILEFRTAARRRRPAEDAFRSLARLTSIPELCRGSRLCGAAAPH